MCDGKTPSGQKCRKHLIFGKEYCKTHYAIFIRDTYGVSVRKYNGQINKEINKAARILRETKHAEHLVEHCAFPGVFPCDNLHVPNNSLCDIHIQQLQQEEQQTIRGRKQQVLLQLIQKHRLKETMLLFKEQNDAFEEFKQTNAKMWPVFMRTIENMIENIIDKREENYEFTDRYYD